MSRLLKEPLLHFLLLGAALFGISSLRDSDSAADSDQQVVVSEGRIRQLVEVFGKTWQRPPTRREIQGLIDDFVLEEIYYREAVTMGLDRGDTIIRRRMRQKLEFLTEDAAGMTDPTDEQLASFLDANQDRFRSSDRYTFRHVHIDPERHGEQLDPHVAGTLERLRQGETVPGDSGLLPASFTESPVATIDRTLGRGFAAQLTGLPAGEWHGPVRSGFGLHLVRIEERIEGTVPELSEIRAKVEREWSHSRNLEARAKVNEELLNRYEVVVEWPTEKGEETASAP